MSRITRKNKLPEIVFTIPDAELINEDLSILLTDTLKLLKKIDNICTIQENCKKCPFFIGLGLPCINPENEVSNLICRISDYLEYDELYK